ncbi:MAG TPA: helix-turn-helix domain-containing protein [Rhizomicrobium sp.]|nr:helix-turn-helix domain-containing protein [Rhizomicrobium sp.]
MKQGNMRDTADCRAIGGVLSRIGDKWSVLIVSRLGAQPMRFNELKREIGGISQRMLTLTLRGLERDGLVTRTIFATIPPRVDYELTPLGRSLLEPVMGLSAWALKHIAKIETARERFDSSAARKQAALPVNSPNLRQTARPTGPRLNSLSGAARARS